MSGMSNCIEAKSTGAEATATQRDACDAAAWICGVLGPLQRTELGWETGAVPTADAVVCTVVLLRREPGFITVRSGLVF